MGAIDPSDEKAAMEVSKEALLDLESNTKIEYDPWLLDDHPLRSYPTECIPGLSAYLDESLGKRKAVFLRAGCLIIACLAAFQCLRLLPTNSKTTLLPHESTPHTPIHTGHGACTFPILDTRPHALESSLNGGCEGLRTAVWMHNGELQIGNAVAGPETEAFLQRFGLNPLLAKFDAGDDSAHSETPDQTFLLMLDAKTPLPEFYPHLIAQLATLRQRGYLSHWNGQDVVRRAVTVVVTGEELSENDCIHPSYSDVFWSVLPEGRVTTGDLTQDGLRHLAPICIA
ncbi:hypothetical protein N7457_005295 [Penicillium paradoxum]|uniref:uncharacterized protein n=1 Tax=Penicillium paradoxum TaxID=176176 RepID=UPI0025468402|nr:uncharacterized protein N7457_005295 [Penicillium paradoxum]KAJ5780135.1 hypothetical protein N7457_005295 [Penicillium paradoxum]